MATVELFDARNPITAGDAILKDALEGRAVVADRESLIHALYSAGDEIGRAWWQVAECGDGVDPYDPATKPEIKALVDALAGVERATEVARAMVASLFPMVA